MICTACDERPAAPRRQRCNHCAHNGAPPSPLPPPDRYWTAATGWRSRAACAGMNPDIFYPVLPGGRGGGPARHALDRAVAICRRCPVAHECLNYSLDNREEHGVWGATTPQDRQALHRIRQRRQEAV